MYNSPIQVVTRPDSGAQCYNASSVYCTVCSPPRIKSCSVTIYTPFTLFYTLPPFSLVITILLSVSMRVWEVFLLSPFNFSPSPSTPLPSTSCQSVLYGHVSIFCVSLFCSLNFTYIWYHMVQGGTSKNGIISGTKAPCSTAFPHQVSIP